MATGLLVLALVTTLIALVAQRVSARRAVTRAAVASAALREPEPSLQPGPLIEMIPALIWRATAAGVIDYVSNRVLTYTRSEVGVHGDYSRVFHLHPDDEAAAVRAWRANCAAGNLHESVFRLRGADGLYRWFQSRAEPVRGVDGGILFWYGVLIDVDAVKRPDKALRDSESSLRQIIDTMPALIWRTNSEGLLDFGNARLERYLGMSFDQFSDNRWAATIHPDDIDAVMRRWQSAVANPVSYESAQRYRRYDGVYRWFQVVGEPLLDAEGRVKCWYGLLIDIHDLMTAQEQQRRMEDALKGVRSRLGRAVQSATIAETSASIAHEINQPLAAVVANAHACIGWLAMEPPNIERARLTIERIIRDGNGAADVVRRIRGLFKQNALAMAALDVNGVINEVLQLLRDDVARRHVEVELRLAEALPPTYADRVQIQQVLVNLINNGIDSMDGQTNSGKALWIRSSHHETYLTVAVGDAGSGIGVDDVDSIFDAFYTTKKEGLGMGLAICRSIVEAHGGRLWVSDNKPQGSIFSFTLPTRIPRAA